MLINAGHVAEVTTTRDWADEELALDPWARQRVLMLEFSPDIIPVLVQGVDYLKYDNCSPGTVTILPFLRWVKCSAFSQPATSQE